MENETTNNPLTEDELTQLKAQLEEERAERIARETEVERLTVDVEALKGESAKAAETVTQLRESLQTAVSKYRELVVASKPHLAEFIQGATISEIDDSVVKASALVEKVKEALEAEAARHEAATTIPAGAPVRTTTPPEGLSSREKIVYGLQSRRK